MLLRAFLYSINHTPIPPISKAGKSLFSGVGKTEFLEHRKLAPGGQILSPTGEGVLFGGLCLLQEHLIHRKATCQLYLYTFALEFLGLVLEIRAYLLLPGKCVYVTWRQRSLL
jgi:hypothetical protein